MAQRILRRSMEHLELFDLDKLTIAPSIYELPSPPLPAPRKHRPEHSTNSSSEYYKFLCDSTRCETDPVYAATPMFRTIPYSKHIKYHRQLLGSHLPADIVKPLPNSSPKSPEPSSAGPVKDLKENPGEEREDEDDDEDGDSDEDDDEDEDDDDSDDDDGGQSSSSSSSSSEENDDDILGDDDNKKGIVETIFNRHKKK
jgi:hypothetical protein